MGALPIVYVMLLVLTGPPAACLTAGLRKIFHARARRRSPSTYYGITTFGALALAFNVAVMRPTLMIALKTHDLVFDRLHLTAFALSWLCVWGWIALTFFSRRRRLAY